MLSIEIIVWALLLGGNYANLVSAAESLLPDLHESLCTVQAWVRAEDLIPSSILNGDLRIKVNPACTEEIVSVALQLRLDEYAEVKFPKKGAVVPTAPVWGNVSSESEDATHTWRPLPFWMKDNMEGSNAERGRYFAALRDPEIWEAHAEERTAWTAAAILHEGSFDYQRPFVLPFAVAMPHVQFPPAHDDRVIHIPSSAESREPVTSAKHGYRYTALVTFAGGRLVEVPAGYTSFHPSPRALPAAQPLSTNVTFSRNKCRGESGLVGPCAALWSSSDDAVVHTARIDLENGGVVHAGDVLKGTVNFHTDTSGIRIVHTLVERSQNHGWAHARAQDGGSAAFSPGSCFVANPTSNEMSTSSWNYAHLFGNEGWCDNERRDRNARKVAAPSVDFEVQIADDAAQNFQMHYAEFQSFLEISIDLPYPADIQNCLNPYTPRGDAQAPASAADLREDLIWDAWRSLDDELPADDAPVYSLSARIPVTILGARKFVVNAPSAPPVHYLDPAGVPSPVLFGVAPSSIEDVMFPIAQPTVSVQPREEILRRMLAPDRPFSPRERAPDYMDGEYAGVLWKKKYMAGIKTYPPVVEGSEEAKGLKKVDAWLADNMKYAPRAQVALAVDPL